MKYFKIVVLLLRGSFFVHAQPVMETGGQTMPNEWIDKDTHHKVIKLTRLEGRSNLSFYFHNDPFIGNTMVFYSSSKNNTTGIAKQEISSTASPDKQIFLLDL